MSTKSYVKFLLIIPIVFTIVFLFGCSPKYNYCTIDTSNYSANSDYLNLPEAPIIELTPEYLQSLQDTDADFYILKNDNLCNYVINNVSSKPLVFLSDAIVTVSANINNINKPFIISIANNLYINLNANIFSNITEQITLNNVIPDDTPSNYIVTDEFVNTNQSENTFSHLINGKIINVYGKGRISEQSNAIINCNTVNMCNADIILSSLNPIICDHVNFYGGSFNIVNSKIGINTDNINIYGGNFNLNNCNTGIKCNNANVYNGKIDINNSKNAIIATSVSKLGGFITIESTYGILSESISILDGYLYANCKQYCVKATKDLFVNGGTNLLITKTANFSAIEAEAAKFIVSGGLLIQNSDYVCTPQYNWLAFSCTSGDILSVANNRQAVNVCVYTSGSILISGIINYTQYSNSGTIVDYKDNFYGLLLQAKVNNWDVKTITQDQKNYGAKIFTSANNYVNGQLF